MWADTVTLTGARGSLVPLRHDHETDLIEAVKDGALWELWYTTVPRPDMVGAEIDRRLELQQQQSMAPFAILDVDGRAVGMTTFMNIDAINQRLEIGSTWCRKSVQRGGLNTEVKLMMLRHCFEQLDCIAVEFRTHVLNQQSRRAIERLGARLDGILRSHMKMANGTIRDTAVYSIPRFDWPTVCSNLEYLLSKSYK
jgi:RimJ/RimL family protein N-acetyltransferase